MALRWTGRPRTSTGHVRGDPRAADGVELRRVPAGLRDVRLTVPELRLRRRRRATSATSAGPIPIRSDRRDRGARPRSGSDGAHEWSGYIPFEDLPRQLDPATGYIVTANNAAGRRRLSRTSSRRSGIRAIGRRGSSSCSRRPTAGLSVEEMAAIQNDTRIGRAERVVRHLDGGSRRRRRTATRSSTRSGRWDGRPRRTASARGVLRVRVPAAPRAVRRRARATWPASTSAAVRRGRR